MPSRSLAFPLRQIILIALHSFYFSAIRVKSTHVVSLELDSVQRETNAWEEQKVIKQIAQLFEVIKSSEGGRLSTLDISAFPSILLAKWEAGVRSLVWVLEIRVLGVD